MSYTAPPMEVSFDGLLFDMDGTVIDSTAAVVKHWHDVGREIGADPEVILQTSHGRRSIDTLRDFAPEKANWEYVKKMEALLPLRYGSDVVEIPGSRALLDDVMNAKAPWSIVTSGTLPLVTGWLKVMKLPVPEHLISAESVKEGKPDPECWNLACADMKLDPVKGDRVLVLEDSPAGIIAGKRAGCKVISVVTSHTLEQVIAAEPDWIVKDLRSVEMVGVKDGVVTLRFNNCLENPEMSRD